ncbi:MAG: hypothetical protein ABR958_05050 [Dehalococcoidales bacterium]
MTALIAERKPQTQTTEILTCQHCGYTGEDVITITEYVGGQGYVTRTCCADEVACWARWDKTNGFEDTPAIKEIQAREVRHGRAM